MKSNKLLLVLLVMSMLFGMMSPAVLAETQTYAYDTLFDDGKELTVAYLGGSITEGAGATATSNRWTTVLTRDFFNGTFKTEHATGTATEVNAGIGGTPSDLGLFRLNHDVSSKAPDIVFVEFAVNDSGTAASEAGALKVQQRMEGIVRQLSKLPKQPVVIFVYTASWKDDSLFNLPLNCAKVHQQVADYYGIGSINLCEYVAGGIDLDGNEIVWGKGLTGTWTGDNTHPNDTGYAKYAEYIAKELTDHPEKYLKKMTTRELPKFGYEYGAPDLVSASGGRAEYDSKWVKGTDQTDWSFRGEYEDLMLTTEAGAVATFDFTGRSIGLFVIRGDRGNSADYVLTNDAGEVVDDGTISNYYAHAAAYNEIKPKGTTMACSTFLLNDLPFDNYTLTLTTTDVGTNGNGYTGDLFAIGHYMVDEEEPAVEAPAYVKPALDISKTDTSIAKDGSTYIQAEYTDSFGITVVNSDSVHLDGITYESSDETVVTIDENGLVTPIQEGTAFINATYDGIESQKLMMIVYSTIDNDVNWDSDTLGTYAKTMQSAQDSALKFINTATIIAGGHQGDSVGQYIHHLQLDKDTMGNDDYAKGTAWKSSANYIQNQITGAAAAADKASVLEMWFYDDGQSSASQFWLAGIRNDEFLKTIATQTELDDALYAKDLRYTFAFNTNDYRFIASNGMAYNPLGTTDRLKNYTVSRKIGWRQFIWDASDDVTKIYVDGQLLAELPIPGFTANQVPSVRFDRFYNAGSPVTTVESVNYYTPITPSHQEMKIDNITLYGTKSTGVAISDLSISHNKTALSLDSEPVQLTAKGVLASGDSIDLNEENVTFSSMDDTVISVGEDGTVTPVGVGLAKVLITSGEYKKTLLITVYEETPYVTDNFDGRGNDSISTANSAQGHGGLLNTYEFTGAETRTGEGLSMHLKDIVISQMWNDKYKTYVEGTPAGADYMRITVPSMKSADAAERGIGELWFYDTMDGNGSNAIYITTVGDSRRIRVKLNASNYYASSEKGTTVVTSNTLTRTEGWHQFIIDYRADNRIDLYIDGALLAYTEGEGANTGISVQHDFMLYPASISDYSTSQQTELYYDDAARYNMTWTDKPTLESAEISDLDLSKNTTYYAEGGVGQVKVIGTFANGQKVDISGDAGLTYTVSHPEVLTVDETGAITALKSGYALVTVTAGDISESLIYAVTNSNSAIRDANNGSIAASATKKDTYAASEYSKEIYRTGVQSYHMIESHSWNDKTLYTNKNGYSFVFTGWIYDEGIGADSVPRLEIGSTNTNDTDGGMNNVKNLTVQMGINSSSAQYYSITSSKANRDYWAPGATRGLKSTPNQYTGNYLNGTSTVTGTFTNPVTGTVTEYPGAAINQVPRTEGWHQFAVVVDGGGTTSENVATPNGKIEYYIDGQLVMTDRYVPHYVHSIWPLGTGYISDYQVTHFSTERKAPVVSEVSLGTEGNIISGTEYTASAAVTDPNGYGQESTIAYTWEVSDNGTDGWSTATETAGFTPTDAGKYVRVSVVPTGTIDQLVGEAAASEVKQIGVANPKLTFAITGNGTVKKDNDSYQNEGILTANNGDSVTLTLAPAEGYQISSVKAGEKDLVVSNNSITLENLNLDTTVTVVYTEREKEKPSVIASESGIQTQSEYLPSNETTPQFAALSYTKIDAGYGYTIKGVGMKLTNKDGAFVLLPHMGTWETTYLYGIRVFGSALISGETYTMTPYLLIEGETDDEYIYGKDQFFTKE